MPLVQKLMSKDWDKITPNSPTTMEQKYYRYLFEKEYRNCGNIIPYFWMPNYVKTNDSSARKLSFYETVRDNAQNLSQIEEETLEEETFTV